VNLPEADWVFGYGSLIWHPEFDYTEQALARLHGFHRAFCIQSTRYRGTPQQPCVVLVLQPGGSCVGMAFRLARPTRRQSLDRLYAREMLADVYRPTLVPVALPCGRSERALTFVANPASEAYQRLSEADILHRLLHAGGDRGHNRDYALNTHRALLALGVHDRRLARLARLLDPESAHGKPPGGRPPPAESPRG
jgi:cation transport protein ChaC